MARWEFAVAIDPSSPTPLFLQIARVMAEDIGRGRLRAGDPLPGTRALAATLSVHRNTVVAAYEELAAEGWVETRSGRGTFVARVLPDPKPKRFSPRPIGMAPSERVAFALRPSPLEFTCLRPHAMKLVLSGWPDLRLLPSAALARALRRGLDRHRGEVLAYAEPHGHRRLRSALSEMLAATRGLPVTPESLLVTRGTQMALALLAHALTGPGDVVAVEDPGYRTGPQAFKLTGARLVPVPVDEQGISVEALEGLLATEPVRVVYVTPHHQFPTTVTLSAGRRLRLLELARAHNLAIVEDDFDHEFHYDGRPVLPMATADAHGVVVYLGTLSKTLAPGLRVGYVVAPPTLIELLAEYRRLLDTQGDLPLEASLAELIEDGEVQRHVRRMRKIYAARRDVILRRLKEEFGSLLHCTPPSGGTALWAEVDPAIDVADWARRAEAQGVVFEPGWRFAFDRRALPFARLGYSSLDEDEIVEAVRLMAASLPERRAAAAERLVSASG